MKLVEDVTEANVARERKRHDKEILDERSTDDPPRELAHYEKLVPETSNETELTARRKSRQGDREDSKLRSNAE